MILTMFLKIILTPSLSLSLSVSSKSSSIRFSHKNFLCTFYLCQTCNMSTISHAHNTENHRQQCCQHTYCAMQSVQDWGKLWAHIVITAFHSPFKFRAHCEEVLQYWKHYQYCSKIMTADATFGPRCYILKEQSLWLIKQL